MVFQVFWQNVLIGCPCSKEIGTTSDNRKMQFDLGRVCTIIACCLRLSRTVGRFLSLTISSVDPWSLIFSRSFQEFSEIVANEYELRFPWFHLGCKHATLIPYTLIASHSKKPLRGLSSPLDYKAKLDYKVKLDYMVYVVINQVFQN